MQYELVHVSLPRQRHTVHPPTNRNYYPYSENADNVRDSKCWSPILRMSRVMRFFNQIARLNVIYTPTRQPVHQPKITTNSDERHPLVVATNSRNARPLTHTLRRRLPALPHVYVTLLATRGAVHYSSYGGVMLIDSPLGSFSIKTDGFLLVTVPNEYLSICQNNQRRSTLRSSCRQLLSRWEQERWLINIQKCTAANVL